MWNNVADDFGIWLDVDVDTLHVKRIDLNNP
jgi:hypothetical protein